MSITTNESNEDKSEKLFFAKKDSQKNPLLLTATFYSFFIIIVIAVFLSFFYYTFIPKYGFFYFLLVFWLSVVSFGITKYDNISRLILILMSLAIGIAFIGLSFIPKMPYLIIYYPILILTLYTLIFDKKTNELFKNSFNKNLTDLYIILFLDYSYLIIDGFLTLPAYVSSEGALTLVHYGFFLLIFLNLIFVQNLNYNARLLMFFTATIFIIYSILTITINFFGVVAIAVNLVMILELKFNKKIQSEFKIVESDNYFLYKTIYYLGLLSALITAVGVLYLYSITLVLLYLALGVILVVFYYICLYKLNRFSFVWRDIFTIFNLGLLIFSIIFFQRFISITAIYLPVSFISIFGLNFDYQTKRLFAKTI